MSSRNSNIKYQKQNHKINANIPIGVQKPGPQYSPAIVVYTLHSIVMVLLYYITS